VAPGVEPLVVWINGAFGVGKSAVADELVRRLPGSVVLDPEPFGAVLRDVVPITEQTDDFQDIPAWRATVRAAVTSLARSRGGHVIVPMALVEPTYHDEIICGIATAGVTVVHLSLVAPASIIRARLRARSSNEEWALARVESCGEALADERFAMHVDASYATPRDLAARLADIVALASPGVHR
jgi:predicted kinase